MVSIDGVGQGWGNGKPHEDGCEGKPPTLMVTGVLNMNAFHCSHHSSTVSILPAYTLMTVGRHT